jgi:hypothetical protein
VTALSFHNNVFFFGSAMGALLDIANPIYKEHPNLEPGGSYVLPLSFFNFVPGFLASGA